MLDVYHLRKEYPSVVAVSDLTFSIGSGEICGFVGPNGAGKTTTMRMIATLDMPSRGEIKIEGISIFDQPYASRRKIGYMPDHLGVYPNMTVTDYLEFYARAYEIEYTDQALRIADVMEFTDLDKIQNKMVETLSKGMRQRLNLGRALLNEPKLLIMDEPAAGLDPRARVELRELVRQLAKLGTTIFISSHILTELGEMCDSMLIIERGELILQGGLNDIKKKLDRSVSTLSIRLINEHHVYLLEKQLLELSSVSGCRTEPNNIILVDFKGSDEEASGLLKEIVNADLSIVEFGIRSESMEELFMLLTKGDIQ